MERFLVDGPSGAPLTLVLAHGAGAPMDSPFMKTVAAGIAKEGFRVLRFEFPYMHARREGGKRGAAGPARGPRGELARRDPRGGRRRGARSTSRSAASPWAGASRAWSRTRPASPGLVCLGYPFHPPGQPEKLRVAHLENLKTPALIVQGERDAFGTRDEISRYPLSKKIRILFLPDGDHSFKPRASSGRTEKAERGRGGRGGHAVSRVSPIFMTQARLVRVARPARRGAEARRGLERRLVRQDDGAPVHRDERLRAEVAPERDGLLGIAVHGPHDRRGLVGADRDEREIERAVTRPPISAKTGP